MRRKFSRGKTRTAPASISSTWHSRPDAARFNQEHHAFYQSEDIRPYAVAKWPYRDGTVDRNSDWGIVNPAGRLSSRFRRRREAVKFAKMLLRLSKMAR